MSVKLPIHDITSPNLSGRCQAAVKEQIPPELSPATQRFFGSCETLYFPSTGGSSSSSKNLTYLSLSVSYSRERSDFPSVKVPGVTKITIVWGRSPLAIRLSKYTGA